ncbi:MAG: BLUF domain-containing protein [Pararhodobacter sp.]
MLHRVIYVSASPSLLPGGDVAELLARSRRRNAAIDVTGLLLYHDGSFLQILEGPAEKVQALFETIRQDTRHRKIITMWSGPVKDRVFPDWSMGFAKVEDLPPPLRDTVFSLRNVSQAATGDRTVTVLLNSFIGSFRDLTTIRFTS